MNPFAYWAANFVVDLLKMWITVGFTVTCFWMFSLNYATAWRTYIMFPIGAIPFSYVVSWIYQSVSAAQTGTMFLNFGLMLFGSTVIFYLRWMPEHEKNGDILGQVLRLFPPYILGAAVHYDASSANLYEYRLATINGKGLNLDKEPWHYTNHGGDFYALVAHFFYWWLILLVLEYAGGRKNQLECRIKSNLKKTWYDEDQEFDEDVTAEAQKVNKLEDKDMQIKVQRLRKEYGSNNLCAVGDLSFGLQKGECFALLGVNGAGKSTTFKILTGAEDPSKGRVRIKGFDMNRDFN